MNGTILVSACLLGKNCRYDGCSKENEDIVEIARKHNTLPLCPEVLGGLPTPRPAADISNGDGNDVLDNKAKVLRKENGTDVTRNFIEGTSRVLSMCEENGIKIAILKERSPSCGVKYIYRNGELVSGMGVTTAALVRKSIKVFSEEDLPEIRRILEEQND